MSLPNTATSVHGPPNRGGPSRQLTLFDPEDVAPISCADPCARKHAGAETSIAAHERVAPHKHQVAERILAAVQARGDAGATVHELAADLGKFPSSISGRLTELRMLGRLAYKHDAATGARVKRGGACALITSEPNGRAGA